MDGRRPGGTRIKTGSTEYISSLLATLSFAVCCCHYESAVHPLTPSSVLRSPLRPRSYPVPCFTLRNFCITLLSSSRWAGVAIYRANYSLPLHSLLWAPPPPVGVVFKIIQYRTVCSYPSHSSFQNDLFRLYRLYRLTSPTKTPKLYNTHWHCYSIKHHHKWFCLYIYDYSYLLHHLIRFEVTVSVFIILSFINQ